MDWAHKICSSETASFDVIVVNTELYRNWSDRDGDRESAFYKTYTLLLQHIVDRAGELTTVYIDDRSDSYPKQHEVVGIVGNHSLSRLASQGRIERVEKVRSVESRGIQVADLLTGIVAAGHRMRLDPTSNIHRGKTLAVDRFAAMLGWDALHYDTFPHAKFNVWHFPSEFRADPGTRHVRLQRPEFVDREALASWLAHH